MLLKIPASCYFIVILINFYLCYKFTPRVTSHLLMFLMITASCYFIMILINFGRNVSVYHQISAKATNTPKCKSGRLNLSVDMTTSTLCRNTAIITLDALYSLLTSVKYTILYSSDMPHQRPLLQTVFPKTAN